MKQTGNNALISMSVEDVIDRVRVMRRQEDTSYLYHTYLPSNDPFMDTGDARGINVVWREKICQWSYNVVDQYVILRVPQLINASLSLVNETNSKQYLITFILRSFELSREVVAVSLSLFDRYFATLGNTYHGNVALLASLTTLHIAIKLYDTKKIKLNTLVNLSRGQFTSRDIEMMEWTILSALRWKLHPPTPYTFVEHILFFLPQEVNGTIRAGLNEVSKYLTELAVCDAFFVDRSNSSTIAFAAILNVMEDMNYSKFSGGLRETFLRNLTYHLHLNHRSDDIVNARRRLRKMFTASSSVNDVMTPVSSNVADYNCVTPQETSPTSPGQENYYGNGITYEDVISLADRSMSSVSVLSTFHLNAGTGLQHPTTTVANPRSSTSCVNSVDTSKSSSVGRYSQKPSPRRANFFASVSPIITSSRAATVASTLIEAGIQ